MKILKTSHEVLTAEKNALKIPKDQPTMGLAISGGGIRSASFGLGVLQSFLERNILQKIDYLSTVSGGGYIGSALTWFRHFHAGENENFFDDTAPFGKKGSGERPQPTFASFLRQHGNYLAPGKWLNLMSSAAVLVRSLLISVFIYFSFLLVAVSVLELLARSSFVDTAYTFLKSLVGTAPFSFPETWTGMEFFRLFALFAAFACTMFVVSAILFCLSSFLLRSSIRLAVYKYRIRNAFQRVEGVILALFILFAVLMTVPVVRNTIGDKVAALGLLGYISGVWGSLATLRTFMGKTKFFKSEWLGVLLFRLSAVLFVYAALVLAFHLSLELSILWLGLILLASCSLAWAMNINDATMASMYRDRLMEVFLPDDDAITKNQWMNAEKANVTLIEKMCDNGNGGIRKPYHLINTNIILVGSKRKTYRNRGGDNFLLSPLFCGSDATGYMVTQAFIKKKLGDKVGMTLATAMATSGAAVSPHTGVGGDGPTRDRFVSVIMTVFNLRLGFWATNPRKRVSNFLPNYIIPGLFSLLGFLGHNEKDRFVELSDGGHFENLGLYELVRRRLDTIIVSDGTADKDFSFGDLANAIERIRSDFGAVIRFKEEEDVLGDMLPGSFPDCSFSEKFKMANKGFACGTISYPPQEDGEEEKTGHIILIKSTMIPGLPADVYGYKAGHRDFPDQPTTDQFFDEKQFEAYRELGYRAGESAALFISTKKEKDVDRGKAVA